MSMDDEEIDEVEEAPQEVNEEVPRAEFEVSREVFRIFVEAARCKGIINVDNEKVKSGDLFKDFVINVTKDGLVIKATDSGQNKVIGQHVYKVYNKEKRPSGCNIISEGSIPVTSIEDFLKAIDLCESNKDDVIRVIYPYTEPNKIFVGVRGSKTGWMFTTHGKSGMTCLANVDAINHVRMPETGQVKSTSKQTGQVVMWKTKLVCIPEEIKKIAFAMKDFVKQKIVLFTMDDVEPLLSLGTPNASRKGAKQLHQVSRHEFVDGKWIMAKKGDNMEKVKGIYFHGFYAVIQSLPDENALEIHFQKFPSPAGPIDNAWIRSYSTTMELNFLVPFEQEKDKT